MYVNAKLTMMPVLSILRGMCHVYYSLMSSTIWVCDVETDSRSMKTHGVLYNF